MPIIKKTFRDFFNLVVGKFNKEVPTVDPTIEASFGRGVSGASAIAGSGLQDGIQDVVNQSFWQTADGDFLSLIGSYDKTPRFSAESAEGFASVGGVLNTLIPNGTQLTAQGNTYAVLQDAIIQDNMGTVSLTFSGGMVTAVTSSVHSLATGLTVTISGATQTDYNGTFTITVLSENTFTYELDAGVLTSDNGSFSSIYALLNIQSIDTGEDTNLDAGASLSINVVDVNDTAFVTSGGVVGGLEEEEEEEYRARVGENHILIAGVAIEGAMINSARKISGNTRIFPFRGQETSVGTPGVTGYIPSLGQTVIYVLRDNDTNIIPSSAILAATKQQILDDRLWPTTVPVTGLYLLAPELLFQDFTFTSITPNTTTMQTAIRAQLVSFFRDNAEVGRPSYTIELDAIKEFLRQVQDQNGVQLESFVLSSPSSDLVAGSGQIYVRGDVNF